MEWHDKYLCRDELAVSEKAKQSMIQNTISFKGIDVDFMNYESDSSAVGIIWPKQTWGNTKLFIFTTNASGVFQMKNSQWENATNFQEACIQN